MQKHKDIHDTKILKPNELRAFKGLSHLSDTEAKKIIESLYKLAEIGIQIMKTK